MKESNKKYECYYPPLSTKTIISLFQKPLLIREFEDKVRVFLGIVGEPQLLDKNFDFWRSIDLNKTIKKIT